MIDYAIRRRVNFERLPIGRYTISVARTLEEYESAFRLVHVGYVFQGIERLHPIDLRVTEQHVLRESIVLVAYDQEQPVGTITVTGDSPAGLPLDADYPEALSRLRGTGARLAEIGSFSIVQRCQKSGLAVLLSMAAVRIAFRTFNASHFIYGVHPKASPLYRAVWGAETLGSPRPHAVLRAPVAGHVSERTRVLEHFRRAFRRPMASGYRPGEHLLWGPPLPCLQMPNISEQQLASFKIPRDIFRSLFIERTNRIQNLSVNTFGYLKTQRTDETLGLIKSPLRKVS
jgi:hypothetical protein